MLSRLTPSAVRSLGRSKARTTSSQSAASVSAIRTHKLPGQRKPTAKYGGRHTVTALPGDGIGPEMVEHIRTIFTYCHAPINFEVVQISSNLIDGDMEGAIMAIERNGVAIKVRFSGDGF
ncbi:unnamed protein product [Heligmosomoides polygyrus]|uniref:Iso_dh domain-containing protein n=1 Tax=Heligmosomoides polygyrus TaxID=6339 RepID=A0A183GL09_HELPZ|nr:unnamed protein product [Heligmosomoides polygyrus]